MTHEMKALIDNMREEAKECLKSANDIRNSDQTRDIFHVAAIVLNNVADNTERELFRENQ